MVRRVAATAVVLTAGVTASPGHADPGPFTGMAGTWGGSGTVALEDGSTERIRCRANYGVSGPRMTLVLTCASDAYKFGLQAEVIAEGSAISGTWSETSRGINGVLQGRGGGGNFQLLATTAGFNANIALATRGKRQSVSIRADSQFRAANISLSR
ncbi:hypothetical protein ACQR10_04005 [Bradyrhizobium sp. HKCCYLRH2060]|uniref:hypothetical protein n=1 Tax=Bradyrhizobium TaxID=374 RepID=UPI0028EAC035|nr:MULTISPECIES: hypothetical protein [unclassified Bradyrhizobium]